MRAFVLQLPFSVLLLLLGLAGGCSTDKVDITRDWSAERIYYAARDELTDKRYEKAIDFYQKLDARYPYGPLAQQGKIEIAYAYWKNDDPASALAACDRFLREHPNHINADYVFTTAKAQKTGFFGGSDMNELMRRFFGDQFPGRTNPRGFEMPRQTGVGSGVIEWHTLARPTPRSTSNRIRLR